MLSRHSGGHRRSMFVFCPYYCFHPFKPDSTWWMPPACVEGWVCMCALAFCFLPSLRLRILNRCEIPLSLNCDRVSVFDLSPGPYLCMSGCLRSINLQKYFNQEQSTPPIIFTHSKPPPQGNVFKYYPLYCSPSQNKWHEEIKPGCSAIFSQSHFILLGLTFRECEQTKYAILALSIMNLKRIHLKMNNFGDKIATEWGKAQPNEMWSCVVCYSIWKRTVNFWRRRIRWKEAREVSTRDAYICATHAKHRLHDFN